MQTGIDLLKHRVQIHTELKSQKPNRLSFYVWLKDSRLDQSVKAKTARAPRFGHDIICIHFISLM